MKISFGESEYERVEIEVLGYELESAASSFDDWLSTRLSVSAGGFRGEVGASILAGDLARLAGPLRRLYETLSGEAKFETIEGQLSLSFVGDGHGHVELNGEMRDQPGSVNRLTFTLALDQSQIAASLRELEDAASAFPVRYV
jgi:hypothetical protein